jgi:hypothetical protein
MNMNINITRDRELVDLLYSSYVQLNELHADLASMEQPHTDNAVTHVDHSHDHLTDKSHLSKEQIQHAKSLEHAIKTNVALQKQYVQIIKLLIQNHTDSISILNEFEKIRTSCIMQTTPFALAHVIPMAGQEHKPHK